MTGSDLSNYLRKGETINGKKQRRQTSEEDADRTSSLKMAAAVITILYCPCLRPDSYSPLINVEWVASAQHTKHIIAQCLAWAAQTCV